MYTFRQGFFIELAATGGNAVIDVPLQTDEALQYVSLVVYAPGHISLPTGSVQLFIGGDSVGSATAFAGNKIVLPLFPQAGEPNLILPATANTFKSFKHLVAGATSSTYTETDPKLQITPMSVFARVTNTSAGAVQLVAEWSAKVNRL